MDRDAITTRSGRRIAVSRIGQGPTVVCHPGGPGFAGDVLGDLGGLDAHFELLRVDPRGTGRSQRDGADDFELRAYVEDLTDLVAALDQRPAAVLGHSHGGLVALLYAAAHPDAFDRLVVVGTPSRIDPPSSDRLGARFGRVDDDDHATTTYGSTGDDYHPELTETAIQPAPLTYFNDHVLDDFDLRSVLGRVAVPTLVVCGRDDQDAGPLLSRELTQQLPDARLAIIEGSGHVPFLENPDAFRQAVLDHLRTDG